MVKDMDWYRLIGVERQKEGKAFHNGSVIDICMLENYTLLLLKYCFQISYPVLLGEAKLVKLAFLKDLWVFL